MAWCQTTCRSEILLQCNTRDRASFDRARRSGTTFGDKQRAIPFHGFEGGVPSGRETRYNGRTTIPFRNAFQGAARCRVCKGTLIGHLRLTPSYTGSKI